MTGLDPSRTVTANLTRQHERQIERVARGLREIADEVERTRLHTASDGKPDFLGQARDVDHALRWGYANLPMDTLLREATAVDRWVRSPGED